MKNKIFTLLSISLLFVFLCDAQTQLNSTDAVQVIKISNGINSANSLSGLNIKQGTKDYLDQSFYNFPDTKVGSTKDVRFVLQNVSGSLMAITAATIVGSGFTKIGTIPNYLNDTQTVYFTIRYSPTVVKRDTAYLLITTDNSADQYYQLNFAGNAIKATGINDLQGDNNCKIYPNPMQESAMVHLNLPDQSKGTFELLNITGQKVYSTSVSANNSSFILQRNNLAAGIYHYIIFDDQNGLITSGKLIFE